MASCDVGFAAGWAPTSTVSAPFAIVRSGAMDAAGAVSREGPGGAHTGLDRDVEHGGQRHRTGGHQPSGAES